MMKSRNLQTVKQANRVTVLNYIQSAEPVSRREIARELSMSPTTASAAVNDLIDKNFVREIGHGSSTGGRRPILLEINPEGGTIISVDISSAYNERIIHAATLDLKSNILQEVTHKQTFADNHAILAAIQTSIESLMDTASASVQPILAIGISVPGLINSANGELMYTNIDNTRLGIKSILEDRFAIPVLVENNEDAAALGEYRFGAGRESASLLYLSVGSGVGSGLIIDGRIYRNGRTSAGELGHITILPEGPLCRCGNHGCLSTLVSSETIVQRINSALDDGYQLQGDLFNNLSAETLNIQQILKAAETGEPFIQTVISQAADWIGIAIANIINILNPEMIVFGGELFEGNDYFLPLVKAVANRRALQTFIPTMHMVQSTLGRSSGLRGIGVLAIDSVLKPAIPVKEV